MAPQPTMEVRTDLAPGGQTRGYQILDHFLLRLKMGYPSAASEKEILRNFADSEPLAQVEPVMSVDEVLEMQQAVRRVAVDDQLVGYTLTIVEKTRQHEYLSLGVSPRGSMSLYRAAQALAFLENRSYCIPDDFKRLVIPVFAHRVVVSTRYVSTLKKGDQAEAMLGEIIDATPVPL